MTLNAVSGRLGALPSRRRADTWARPCTDRPPRLSAVALRVVAGQVQTAQPVMTPVKCDKWVDARDPSAA
jgi:hypothetical protein